MCKFCEALLNGKTIEWSERSFVADDNFCEAVCNDNCDGCSGCDETGFALTSYVSNGKVYVSVEYYRSAYGTTIHPFSESMPFNFCSFCGEQLSKNVEEFNENDWRYSIRED